MIDTGAPNTMIDLNSVNTFGLIVEKNGANVGGLFGRSWERHGASKVKSIAMGNCTITNVPVAIADLSSMNRDRISSEIGLHIAQSRNLAHLNGVLGARGMVKFGMIVDLHPTDALRESKRSEFYGEPEACRFPGRPRVYPNPDAAKCEPSFRRCRRSERKSYALHCGYRLGDYTDRYASSSEIWNGSDTSRWLWRWRGRRIG
ncbi:MAG: hypothetical protein C5B58_02565 [Acidobacteria bacterium]|nr:MAG: hypothetical protein C5B58_02565 [Acidobacteriota bacterium]